MYLLDAYDNPYGGTEGQLLTLVKHLDKSRYTPSVTVFRPTAYLEEHRLPCPVTVLNMTKIARFSTALKLIRYAQGIRYSGFKIVHIFLNDASIVAPIFLKAFGLKVVVSRRDMGYWYNRSNVRLLRLDRHFVDKIICNSEAVKRRVQQVERYPDSKMAVIYNGYDYDQASASETLPRARLGVPLESPIIGLVANLRPIKRIDDAIHALALVLKRCPTVHLVIVGEDLGAAGGPGHQVELESLARSLGVADKVHFMGQIAGAAAVVRYFTVGLLCSESEGFSNAILEYMSCGVPTVCTNAGGNTEIIRHGLNGFLFDVGDVVRAAECICRLLTNPDLASELGRNAFTYATENFTLAKMIGAHTELYARLRSAQVN